MPLTSGKGGQRLRLCRHGDVVSLAEGKSCRRERNHQGKDNLLPFPSPTLPLNPNLGKVRCRERLGGLLKYYEREAA